MIIKITFYCPCCRSAEVRKNGRKPSGKQNYLCRNCECQVSGNYALTYRGCNSSLTQRILRMSVCGVRVMDAAETEQVSVRKVLSTMPWAGATGKQRGCCEAG